MPGNGDSPTLARATTVEPDVASGSTLSARGLKDQPRDLAGARHGDRVRGAAQLDDVTGAGTLGHPLLGPRRDVLVRGRDQEPRRDRVPRGFAGGCGECDVTDRPLGHGCQRRLLPGYVRGELGGELVLLDGQIVGAVAERVLAEGVPERAARELGGQPER